MSLLFFIVAICLLVFVHEYGHYRAALACGIVVRKFSVGFGKPLWSRTDSRGVEWSVAMIPFGGYVQMKESGASDGDTNGAFDLAPPYKRIIVAFAGPFANLLFAFLIWILIYLTGVASFPPELSAPKPGTPAAIAGFEGGLVRSVDGKSVTTAEDLVAGMLSGVSEKKAFVLEYLVANGEVKKTEIRIESGLQAKTSPISQFGWAGVGPAIPPIIGGVSKNGPADKAGFFVGDVVLSVNDSKISRWEEISEELQKNEKTEARFIVQREGENIEIFASPEKDSGRNIIGIQMDASISESLKTKQTYGLLDAIGNSFEKTLSTTQMLVKTVWGLLSGNVSSKNLSGPLGIAEQAGKSGSAGIQSFMSFLAFLSLSLFIMNLLPLPVLDGGHIILAVVETVKGAPIGEAALRHLSGVGLTLLLGLMCYSFFNDLSRLF